MSKMTQPPSKGLYEITEIAQWCDVPVGELVNWILDDLIPIHRHSKQIMLKQGEVLAAMLDYHLFGDSNSDYLMGSLDTENLLDVMTEEESIQLRCPFDFGGQSMEEHIIYES